MIVNNGYLQWSSTVPPYKITMDDTERRWSHWCKSLRKDEECTFGILKGRWKILKTGIRLQGLDNTDNIWLTCCALHNWLLEVDGLDGEWDGAMGQLEAVDVLHHAPFAMQRLSLGFDPRDYDESGLGPGEDRIGREVEMLTVNDTVDNNDEPEQNGAYFNIRHLGLTYFRRKLIEHFDILFKYNEIVWPSQRSHNDYFFLV